MDKIYTQEDLDKAIADEAKKREEAVRKDYSLREEDLIADNKKLTGRMERIESERRTERVERWIADQKKAGKIAPVEEPRIRALRMHLKDDGDEVKVYSSDGKEAAVPSARLFEELIEKRPSLFDTLSNHEGEPRDGLDDPGAELTEKAREYVKKNPSATMQEAMVSVMRDNQDLARQWSQARH